MIPTEKNRILTAVDWQEICPWLLFRRCLGLCFSFRLLFFATLHLLFCALWLALAFGVVRNSITMDSFLEHYSFVSVSTFLPEKPGCTWSAPTPFFKEEGSTEIDYVPPCGYVPPTNYVPESTPLAEMIGEMSKNSNMVRNSAVPGNIPVKSEAVSVKTIVNRVLAVSYAIFSTLLVWMLTARLSALRIARDLRGYVISELKFAFSRLPSVLAAAFFLTLGCTIFTVPLWICRFLPTGVFACVTPLLLIYAAFVFFFLLGAALSVPFVLSVFMTENSDVFDALSRSYAYALQKPLNFVFYILAAAFFGILGVFGVGICVGLITHLYAVLACSKTVEFGDPIYTLLLALSWVISAFGFLYVISALQGIYMLLRRDVDGVELDVVWFEHPQGVPIPKLPDLKSDPKNLSDT